VFIYQGTLKIICFLRDTADSSKNLYYFISAFKDWGMDLAFIDSRKSRYMLQALIVRSAAQFPVPHKEHFSLLLLFSTHTQN
jgi:hypothetical protein